MNDLALFVMVGTSFPLAFGIARLCLAGVMRMLERQPGR
jgi:hypothetical protein